MRLGDALEGLDFVVEMLEEAELIELGDCGEYVDGPDGAHRGVLGVILREAEDATSLEISGNRCPVYQPCVEESF